MMDVYEATAALKRRNPLGSSNVIER